MDPKHRPEGQTSDSIKDRQVGVLQVDKRAAKSGTDSDARLAQRRDNLQKEAIPPPIGAKREEANGQMENHANDRGQAYTSAIGKTTPSRYKEQ